MAIKAKYAQGNMNGYTMESSPYTLRAMEEAEVEKNVKAGKKAVKVMALGGVGFLLVQILTGCCTSTGASCVAHFLTGG